MPKPRDPKASEWFQHPVEVIDLKSDLPYRTGLVRFFRFGTSARPVSCLLLPALLVLTITPARADEVDDLLAKKARHFAKVKKFSADFLVETRYPEAPSSAEPTRIRYRSRMTRVHDGATHGKGSPWTTEIELFEPQSSAIRMEGETFSRRNAKGEWEPIQIPAAQRQQIEAMAGQFTGSDPGEQRKHSQIRILRRNNPIFGPKTVTLETVPHGANRLFARLEEDVRPDDGFALATRIFGQDGKPAVTIRVTKHRSLNGISLMEMMEATTESARGPIVTRTSCTGIVCE